ncbi:MAG: hypothetical protein ACRD22_00635, partial [Terriglobia bacterium]
EILPGFAGTGRFALSKVIHSLSFPRKRESRMFRTVLDPRSPAFAEGKLRGGDRAWRLSSTWVGQRSM